MKADLSQNYNVNVKSNWTEVINIEGLAACMIAQIISHLATIVSHNDGANSQWRWSSKSCRSRVDMLALPRQGNLKISLRKVDTVAEQATVPEKAMNEDYMSNLPINIS